MLPLFSLFSSFGQSNRCTYPRTSSQENVDAFSPPRFARALPRVAKNHQCLHLRSPRAAVSPAQAERSQPSAVERLLRALQQSLGRVEPERGLAV